MDRQRWQHIQTIFEAALRHDTAGRAVFVDRACASDAALRAEVLALLAHEAQARREQFLQPPPGNSATPPPDDGRTGVNPPSRLTDYEILSELGRGGMSVVYRARQVKLNRLVALKMLLSGEQAGADELARFRGEARALARLQHPNIVQIHDVGEHEGRPYFALELVDGGSLRDYLGGTPLPPRQAAELVQTLARAIHAAHQCGIIHRDLKPGNVLLQKSLTQSRQDAKKDEEREDEGNLHPSSSSLGVLASLREALPKITDFGLAKRLDESGTRTQSGAFLGTPSYTAPEQAEGEASRIGPATDVYGLGAILYELLTGRPPFRAETTLETLRLVTTAEPARPRSLAPRLPRDLETICLKCLRKEPQRRYASAADLAEDLRRFLDGEVIRARPAAVPERVAKWVRRRPAAAVALLVAILAALGLPAALVWHNLALREAYSRVEQSERQARTNEARARQLAYASEVRLADQLFKNGDLGRMTELLQRQVPAAAEEDRRGFAWRCLWRYRQTLPRPVHAHDGQVFLIGLAADGRVRVTAGGDGLVKFWGEDPARAAVVFPFHWNVFRGTSVVALSPDGQTLAALSAPTTVTLWDVGTAQVKRRLEPVISTWRVRFSPDGRLLALGGEGEVQLWDLARGKPCGRMATGEGEVRLIEFSPDGQTFATRDDHPPGSLRLWDIATGAPRGEIPWPKGCPPACYSPRGTYLAAADTRVILEERSSGTALDWPALEKIGRPAIAFSPDEQTLALGSGEGDITFWNVPSKTFQGHLHWQGASISCLAFTADGRRLAVGTGAGRVYEVDRPEPQGPGELRPVLGDGSALALTGDGKTLAVGDQAGMMHLIDTGSGEVRRSFRVSANSVSQLALSRDGRTVATTDRLHGAVNLWDAATGRKTAHLEEEGGTECLAFSPVGPYLAVGAGDGQVDLWDLTAPPGDIPWGGNRRRWPLPFSFRTAEASPPAVGMARSNSGTWGPQPPRRAPGLPCTRDLLSTPLPYLQTAARWPPRATTDGCWHGSWREKIDPSSRTLPPCETGDTPFGIWTSSATTRWSSSKRRRVSGSWTWRRDTRSVGR
jgi:serine/threonine protein kinase/WD40 repeat protein